MIDLYDKELIFIYFDWFEKQLEDDSVVLSAINEFRIDLLIDEIK